MEFLWTKNADLSISDKGFKDDPLFNALGMIAIEADGHRWVPPSYNDRSLMFPPPKTRKNLRPLILAELVVFYDVSNKM